MNKNIKTLFLITLVVLSLLTQAAMGLDFKPYVDGSSIRTSVKTKFTNNTVSYKLWFRASALALGCKIELAEFEPIGSFWVKPNLAVESINRRIMSKGMGYIFFREWGSADNSWPDVNEKSNYVTFPLEEDTYEFDHFIVTVKAKPVPVLVWLNNDEAPDDNNYWTLVMDDFDITVSEKEKVEF